MLLINPKADIPIVQLSVMSSDSPAQHYAPVRDPGIAILGSGMPTFHNLRLIFSGATSDSGVQRRNKKWSERLTATVTKKEAKDRGKLLESWRKWVGVKRQILRVEHFLPLVVCAGCGRWEGQGLWG